MENKILIFDNPEDFIQVMENLQEQYLIQHEGAEEDNV